MSSRRTIRRHAAPPPARLQHPTSALLNPPFNTKIENLRSFATHVSPDSLPPRHPATALRHPHRPAARPPRPVGTPPAATPPRSRPPQQRAASHPIRGPPRPPTPSRHCTRRRQQVCRPAPPDTCLAVCPAGMVAPDNLGFLGLCWLWRGGGRTASRRNIFDDAGYWQSAQPLQGPSFSRFPLRTRLCTPTATTRRAITRHQAAPSAGRSSGSPRHRERHPAGLPVGLSACQPPILADPRPPRRLAPPPPSPVDAR